MLIQAKLIGKANCSEVCVESINDENEYSKRVEKKEVFHWDNGMRRGAILVVSFRCVVIDDNRHTHLYYVKWV